MSPPRPAARVERAPPLRGGKLPGRIPPMVPDSPRSISQLLDAWGRGDRAALDALVPEVYAILHQQARHALRDQPDGHTLQPTALVNEAYVRLVNQPGVGSESRSHFLAVAAMVMRSVLVDHARARQRLKRGANPRAVSLGAADAAAVEEPVDVIALDDALHRLATQDERKARIVELRYFVGLSIEETAKALDSSPATVKREWATARAWLRRALTTA